MRRAEVLNNTDPCRHRHATSPSVSTSWFTLFRHMTPKDPTAQLIETTTALHFLIESSAIQIHFACTRNY